MIEKVTMYAVRCDRCNEIFIDPNTDFSAFVDECCAVEEAKENKWIEINGKYYCPNCYEYDNEADEYKPKND